MAMFDDGAGHVHAGPAALPGAIAEVEIFHVGGFVDLIDIAQRAQFGGVVERAAAAAVEHVAAVFAGQGLIAAHGEIFGRGLREDGLAGLLAADAGREADLRGGAEEVGDLVEGALQGGEEAGLEQHVVVEQADVRAAGAGDAAVDGAGEGERGGGVDDFDLRVGGGEPGGGVVGAAVIDDDDLVGGLGEEAGELGLEQFFAGAGGDDYGDAGWERRRDGGDATWAGRKASDWPGGMSGNESRRRSGRAGANPPCARRARLQRRALAARHAMWRAMAGREPGRSMKWLRFSLKARKARGERTRASRRMRRKGTLGTSITPARRISWPRSSSRQRRRFSAKVRLTR